MKLSTKEAVNSLLDLNEQCSEHLHDAISVLLIATESHNQDKQTISNLANNVRDWMNSYYVWVCNSVDSIIETL